MINLYIDTSSSYLYSALIKDKKILQEVKENYGQKLSVEALPQIIKLFEIASITPKDIEKIFVVVGPGSFTGIRIGVTIAKTMAFSLKKSIIPVSSLKAMAISARKDTPYIMPLIDARRGYVYGAVYDKNMREVVKEQHILLTELVDKVPDTYSVISNDQLPVTVSREEYDPDILKIVTFYDSEKPISPHLVNPNYLKRTEAEEKHGVW